MSAEIDGIVAADRAAAREIDGVRESLAARLQAERERLARGADEARAASERRVESEAARLEREGRARIESRRAARAAARNVIRGRTESVLTRAVAAYIAIVRGDGGAGP